MKKDRFNFENTFFRDLTVCVLDKLEGQLRWVNRFSSGDVPVDVPFYYSMTGDERFLLDSFQDDIASNERYVELNTDIIPRGHVTLKNFNIISDEFANPNVWLRMVVENKEEIRKVLTKVKAIPVSVKYDIEILLNSELDSFKCSQSIMDMFWLYQFMYFEYNYMNIDAVMMLPDENQIEITREKTMSSDNTIKMTISLEVKTYYPAYRMDRLNMDGYESYDGSSMSSKNSHDENGGLSDHFEKVSDFTGGDSYGKVEYGEKASFNDESNYPTGTNPDDGYTSSTKRVRWLNNIRKSKDGPNKRTPKNGKK